MRRSAIALAIACATVLVSASGAAAASGSPKDPDAKRFVDAVSVDRIVQHQVALQQVASLNGDTREVFSPGYSASLDYVTSTLENAGYDAKVTQFNFPFWRESQPPVLNQVTPTAKTYRPGTAADNDSPNVDFITMANSPTAVLDNARVVPVGGIVIPSPGGGASGCQASDYPAEVRGNVALVQRGTCAFVDKWALAQQAGATGVIIFNEGNTPARQNPLFVDNQIDATIPAVISSFALGNELYQAFQAGQNPTVDFEVYGTFQDRFLPQVLAETSGGDPNHVVVVGAHLDSVPAGPGINDDGSGTASLLAMAQEVASRPKSKLRQKIRFAWWGAEENGLVGSSYYAHTLPQEEVDKIDVMLDYDMLASPNYVRFIYDGDGNAAPDNPAGPEGSGKVEQVFADWFASKGMASDRVPFDGRSDYVGFTDRGIPAGGVFAGAEGRKTAEQEQIYGGAADSWYDPCYHQLCDNLMTVMTGIPPMDAQGLAFYLDDPTDADRQAAREKMVGGSLKSLDELSDAASYAVWYFSSVRDPFGSRGHGKGANALRGAKGHTFQGPSRLKR